MSKRQRPRVSWFIALCLLFGPAAYASAADAADAATTHYQQGLAYERLGRLEEAYTELQLACTLQTDDARMSLALGIVALRLRRDDVAQRNLEHSIALDAGSIASYYELAYLYEKQHLADRAIDSWHRFLELNQDEVLRGEARKHIKWLEAQKAAT
jgi:tetratricopeptide (TPR) repeat protein